MQIIKYLQNRIYFTIVMIVGLSLFSTAVPSQIFSKSLKKAILSKIGKESAKQAGKTTAKRATANNVHLAEMTALKKQLTSLDRQTMDQIERHYGSYISKSVMRNARSTPTSFYDAKSYGEYLLRVHPSISSAERKQMLGHSFNNKTYANQNHIELPQTVVHERFHQLSNRQYFEKGGERLSEGTTEYLTTKIYPGLHLKDIPAVYPREKKVVEMIALRIGDKRLAKAYFQGDMISLERSLDAQLGKGSFKAVTKAMELKQFDTAENILKYGLP